MAVQNPDFVARLVPALGLVGAEDDGLVLVGLRQLDFGAELEHEEPRRR